jgi:hypothetical protein
MVTSCLNFLLNKETNLRRATDLLPADCVFDTREVSRRGEIFT